MGKPSQSLIKDANGGAIQTFAPTAQYTAGRYYVAPATIHSPIVDGTVTYNEGSPITQFKGEEFVVPQDVEVLEASADFRASGKCYPAPTGATIDFTLTVANAPAGAPTEGKVGAFKDPLDPTYDFGDIVPSTDGVFDVLEITANPTNNSIYMFIRPAEQVTTRTIIMDGVRLTKGESGGYTAISETLTDKIIGALGSSLVLTTVFR